MRPWILSMTVHPLFNGNAEMSINVWYGKLLRIIVRKDDAHTLPLARWQWVRACDAIYRQGLFWAILQE